MASNQSHSLDATSELDHISQEVETTQPTAAAEPLGGSDELFLNDPRGAEISSPYIQRWEVLISTTNWEKGRIICEWRSALESDGAPVSACSDEAWAKRVGGVTSQHVGRLRRVYTRFGEARTSFANLSWTHFLAALDWDDAEMWLEGAVASKWSVSNMREARWETMGRDPAAEPMAADIASTSVDEDFTPLAEPIAQTATDEDKGEVAEGPRYDGPDFGDEDSEVSAASVSAEGDDSDEMPWDAGSAEPASSPFATLPKLPIDVADALEQFKLAIIRHRAGGWQEIPQSDLIMTLDALRTFASA